MKAVGLPRARTDVVGETYFGTWVPDPYRWMEDWQSEESRAWLEGQAAYARTCLHALPEREPLYTRLRELSGAGSSIMHFKLAGRRVYYLRRDPGDELSKLTTRTLLDGEELTLLDPNESPWREGGVPNSIDWYTPSPDGRHVALGIARGGSEQTTLRVLDVAHRAFLNDIIPARLGAGEAYGGVTWLDDRSFVYSRFPDSSDLGVLRDLDRCMYLHQLGSDPTDDAAIFGRDVNARVAITSTDYPGLVLTPSGEWMLGILTHGLSKGTTVYAAPRAALHDPSAIAWRKIADVEDGVTRVALHGGTVYLLAHQGAPLGSVLAVDLKRLGIDSTVIIPESSAIVEDLLVAGDALLLRELDGGISALRQVPIAGGDPKSVPLPFRGTITGWAGAPDETDVILAISSWTEPPRLFRYDGATGELADTNWLPPLGEVIEIEAHEVFAPSRDGVLVPLSIIHRKGISRDGENLTILQGYGSYGISLLPTFSPRMLAWYERGGVLAVAHVRGGGEYGPPWHEAGRLLGKRNTIDDFIACAEYLVREGYTRPGRLAAEGASAGGIPVGNALVERPDLFAAVVLRNAVTNWLRVEVVDQLGSVSIPENGSTATEEGFRALALMDAYTKVRSGVAYPAVLLTMALNDPRVASCHPMKMAARLQAATTSGKPILLRVALEGGHGTGAARDGWDQILADEFAFLLDQLAG